MSCSRVLSRHSARLRPTVRATFANSKLFVEPQLRPQQWVRCDFWGTRQCSHLVDVTKPQITGGQLIKIASASGVGLVGFGFVDNFLMIVAGDFIDARLGATLGISALAAAAFGNLFSDVTGHYFGDFIDKVATAMGLEEPALTDEQKELPSYRRAQRHGGAVGLTIGCVLGMCPLIWMGKRPVQLNEEEKAIYDMAFVPRRVSLDVFQGLMQVGTTKRANHGDIIIEQGKVLNKVVLLCRGTCNAINNEGTAEAIYYSVFCSKSTAAPWPQSRGPIIGGTRLVDRVVSGNVVDYSKRTYVNSIVAGGPVSYVEWDFNDLAEFCAANPEASNFFCSQIMEDIKRRANQERSDKRAQSSMNKSKLLTPLEMMDGVVADVVSDEYISPDERRMVSFLFEKMDLTDEEFKTVLGKHGWSYADFKRGTRPGGPAPSYIYNIGQRISRH